VAEWVRGVSESEKERKREKKRVEKNKEKYCTSETKRKRR
jgi:hypothetical protein